ncbi:hypothetical protein [Clostridium sp.]|nr:hypothetical protein [Clostridium sp.]
MAESAVPNPDKPIEAALLILPKSPTLEPTFLGFNPTLAIFLL